ncbi:hypothetical protein NF27_GP00100 [Candidatus Jidaibacter acanthamoeba]|uniref:Uncharacterized protein n=1 Tax=Candidatus Jidaibacter acanthamoebae TaxID=86105 RepID=A0A0C1QGI6_9RICK|nr:hypothetical protein NF27_GP00100 [Candidatus Jidaibacter acanthamoeba]
MWIRVVLILICIDPSGGRKEENLFMEKDQVAQALVVPDQVVRKQILNSLIKLLTHHTAYNLGVS